MSSGGLHCIFREDLDWMSESEDKAERLACVQKRVLEPLQLGNVRFRGDNKQQERLTHR